MAGGGLIGLTSQTSVATSCGPDWISVGNPARQLSVPGSNDSAK
jgi:hypothetical protein